MTAAVSAAVIVGGMTAVIVGTFASEQLAALGSLVLLLVLASAMLVNSHQE
jgi:hypothetical protein